MSGKRNMVWPIAEASRAALLERFPPRYARVVAHHVTYGRVERASDVPTPQTARVVGRVDDDAGVEALIVEVDGSTDRPLGGTYHLTWSLGEGRAAKESNDAIAAHGWTPLDEAVTQRLEAAEAY